MAKYTELLGEYLSDGGVLPSSFGLIPAIKVSENETKNFDEIFIQHFIDREIGFETDELFTIKLTAKADEVCALYAKRIEDIASVSIKDNVYKEVQKSKLDATTDERRNYNNPLENASGNFSVAGFNDGEKSNNGERNSKNVLKKKGISPDKIIDVLEYYEKGIVNVYSQLLNEFETCFMCIL